MKVRFVVSLILLLTLIYSGHGDELKLETQEGAAFKVSYSNLSKIGDKYLYADIYLTNKTGRFYDVNVLFKNSSIITGGKNLFVIRPGEQNAFICSAKFVASPMESSVELRTDRTSAHLQVFSLIDFTIGLTLNTRLGIENVPDMAGSIFELSGLPLEGALLQLVGDLNKLQDDHSLWESAEFAGHVSKALVEVEKQKPQLSRQLMRLGLSADKISKIFNGLGNASYIIELASRVKNGVKTVQDYSALTPKSETVSIKLATVPDSQSFQPSDPILVTVQQLHIRTGPGTSYPFLHHLSYGDKGVILYHPDNGVRVGSFRWWYVRIEHIYSDGSGRVETFTGWVAEGPEDGPYIQSADDVLHSLIPGDDSDEIEPDPEPVPEDPIYTPPSEPSPPTSFARLEPLAVTLTPAEPEKLVPVELGGQVNGRGTYGTAPFPDWFFDRSEGSSVRIGVADYSRVEISQTFVFKISSSDTMRYRDIEVSVVSPTDWEAQLEDARYLDVPEEYQTIDSALAKAQSGQTIRVAAGEYNVSKLDLKDNISLEGNGSVLNLSSGEGSVLRTEAKGVKLSNLTLKGIGKDRVRTYGLYLGDGAEVELDNISFLDFYNGIESEARPSNGQGVSVSIRNNLFKDCHQGVSALSGATLEVKDSQFLNNQKVGLYIYNPASVLLEGLQVSGSEKAIILQENQKQPAILKKLTIKTNREGIYIDQSWAEISDSDVSENQLIGILVRGRARVTNTLLKNNGSGLYFGFSSTDMDRETKEVSRCQIIGSKEVGIQIYHKSLTKTRVSISNSDIFNNHGANLKLIDQLKSCSVSLSDIFFNTLDETTVRQTITVPDDKQLNLINLRSQGAVDSSLRTVSTQELASVIAYVSAETGQKNLFLINPDGSNKKKLTNLAFNNLVIEGTELQFSPQGDWLAFRAKNINDNNWDIWLVRTTGQELRNLTNHPSDDQFPVWLTNDTIAFTSYREGGPDIWQIDLGGRNQQKLLALGGVYSLSYNRALNKFAFVLLKNGTFEVHTINLDGSDLKRLTDNSVHEWNTAWSPDGKEIVFSSERSGWWEIYLMAANGDDQRQLTLLKQDASNPSFSPDGRRIVFSSGDEIYTMNSDGKEVKKLTNNQVYDWNPVWSPLISINLATAPAQLRPTPRGSRLLQSFPNPANPETWIPYLLKQESEIILLIHDVKGVLVRRIELGHKPTGNYTDKAKAIYWNGRNEFGEPVASGIYFYTLQTNHLTSTRKLIIRR